MKENIGNFFSIENISEWQKAKCSQTYQQAFMDHMDIQN